MSVALAPESSATATRAISAPAARAWLVAGLAFAVGIAPFVGGIRGIPLYIGWLALPAVWLFQGGAPQTIGLSLPARAGRVLLTAFVSGLLLGAVLLWASRSLPQVTAFILLLPDMHAASTGGSMTIFLLLIPIAHTIHELFYRGCLQGRLTAALETPFAGTLLAAVLFAWTHVFVFAGMSLPAQTLQGVLIYTLIESVVAGTFREMTGSIWPGVLSRATALGLISVVMYRGAGML